MLLSKVLIKMYFQNPVPMLIGKELAGLQPDRRAFTYIGRDGS
jgi:hypothetical protein